MAGIPYDDEEVDYDEPGPARDRLFSLNPLGQVPTLIMPDGSIMTESAAIIFMIDDKVPEAGLVPPAGSAERNGFLRWLIFIVAAIYPTHTYGDDPKKWLPGVADPKVLRDNHGPASREALAAGREPTIEPQPWFLGTRLLRARHLCRRDDALAPAPGMVRGGMPEARRRRRGGAAPAGARAAVSRAVRLGPSSFRPRAAQPHRESRNPHKTLREAPIPVLRYDGQNAQTRVPRRSLLIPDLACARAVRDDE